MSTWSDTPLPVREFEYPAVGKEGDTQTLTDAKANTIREEDVVRRETHAHQLGRQEGESAARADYEQALQQERTLLVNAVEAFRVERDKYFHAAETEVVQLTLAITRKILNRESRVDPLFLRAAVRVALEKLRDESQISVRVSPTLAEDWRRFLATAEEGGERVQVLADESLPEMTCVVEASIGTTEIGVESRLKEIEHEFLDLLAMRPQAKQCNV